MNNLFVEIFINFFHSQSQRLRLTREKERKKGKLFPNFPTFSIVESSQTTSDEREKRKMLNKLLNQNGLETRDS